MFTDAPNLCNFRWWATDSPLVAGLDDAGAEASTHASRRLSVIRDSYTVYKDIWLLDADGMIVANGRPEQYRWSTAMSPGPRGSGTH